MKTAISLYLGGNIVDAGNGDYSASRNLGLVCPFCRDAVFWVKPHDGVPPRKLRLGKPVSASWKHYKLSIDSTEE